MSNIYSMTASARCSEQGAFGDATWEIRSVNHRYLDTSIRLPDFLSMIELKAREVIREKLQRGRIDCYLKYQPSSKTSLQFKIDENLVEQILKSASFISGKIRKPAKIDPLTILNLPHVLQKEELNQDMASAAVLKLLHQTLDELLIVRAREGNALKLIIEKNLSSITNEVARIRQYLPEVLGGIRKKIISKLDEIKVQLDQNRLEQEIVYFAHKIDIAEELDRLDIHLNEFTRIINNGGNIGKRLDFLTQELNREANTIASKSADVRITQSAVEIKVLLEQIREQVQNIE